MKLMFMILRIAPNSLIGHADEGGGCSKSELSAGKRCSSERQSVFSMCVLSFIMMFQLHEDE